MSWQAVARKDFTDAIRSRALWAISALFILLSVGVAAAYATFPDELAAGNPTPLGLTFFLASTISTFVAITAILICYKAVAGERETGSILLTLALPHTRTDVVLGKVLGRTGVLAVPVLIALLLGTLVGSVMLGAFDAVALVALLAVSVFFALTYVSVMVGLSAITGSSGRAAALAIGFFFVFELLWGAVTLLLVFVTSGFSLPNPANYPEWTYLLNQVPPSSAYITAMSAVIPGAAESVSTAQGGGSLDAFFTTPWVALVMLAVWLIVPILIGWRRFVRADL